MINTYKVIFLFSISLMIVSGCSSKKLTKNSPDNFTTIQANMGADGNQIIIDLIRGNSHNHPSFAIWLETLEGEFIETLFVTKSVGTGYYGHGQITKEQWDNKSGPQERPASLPFWLHKRMGPNAKMVLPTPDKPVLDALTGATPLANAKILTKTSSKLKSQVRLMVEVNQPWDWNAYWHNTKFDDFDYRTSCQPSIIYSVNLDLSATSELVHLNPIGHGDPAGKSGKLNTNLTTLTTAKDIFSDIQVLVN